MKGESTMKSSTKTHKFQVVSLPDCDGNMQESILYDAQKKQFLKKTSRLGNPDMLQRIPLTERFKHLFMHGSNHIDFECHMCIPDFKRLYREITKGQKPIFKKGEIVWDQNDNGTINFYEVGEHIGWTLNNTCDLSSGEPLPLIAIRVFIETKRGIVLKFRETRFKPMSDYEDWEAGRKAVLAARAVLKKEGEVGGTIFYKGKVYRF